MDVIIRPGDTHYDYHMDKLKELLKTDKPNIHDVAIEEVMSLKKMLRHILERHGVKRSEFATPSNLYMQVRVYYNDFPMITGVIGTIDVIASIGDPEEITTSLAELISIKSTLDAVSSWIDSKDELR